MAYSYTLFNGDGSNTIFSFSFAYLDQSHVSAEVNGVPVSYSWLSTNSINISPAPGAGTVVRVKRSTPKDEPPVDFSDGSVLKESDLDLLALFNLYCAQEAADGVDASVSLNASGILDGKGRATTNFADPIGPTSLVTLKYLNDTYDADIDARVAAAAASASASATSASQSQGYAIAADSSADLAATLLASFRGMYLGAQATNPTVDGNGQPVSTGDLYFNTTQNVMKVYGGASWINAGSTISSTINVPATPVIATAGQTSVPVPGGYDAGFISVFVDGAKVDPPEVTVTSGTNIVFPTPLTGGEEISWVAYGAFSVANVRTRAELESSAGGSYINTIAAGVGAVARSLEAEFRDTIKAVQYGVIPGEADSTVKMQNAINAAAGRILELPAGIINVSTLTGISNIRIKGQGRDLTTIKRINNEGTTNPILGFTNQSNFHIEGITFDGNRTNQTTGTNNVQLFGCAYWTITKCRFNRAKAVAGGYGSGLGVFNGTNGPSQTSSLIQSNLADNNDGVGIQVTKDWYVTLDDNFCNANGNGGIAVVNHDNPPPSTPTDQFLIVTRNRCVANTGTGLSVTGFIDSYNGALGVTGYNHPTAYGMIISHNILDSNTIYGLAFQSTNSIISHNIITKNGNATTNGGVLMNAQHSLFLGNMVAENFFYGVDAGGALNMQFNDNTFRSNGTGGLGCYALNVSGGQMNAIKGNRFILNGSASGGVNIGVGAYDGGTDPVFPLIQQHTWIKDNEFQLLNNNVYGVNTSGGVGSITLRNNDAFNGSPFKAFSISSYGVKRVGNAHWVSGGTETAVASASTIVIPDAAEEIYVSGTGNIDNIRTEANNTLFQKISSVQVNSQGSYPPGVPVTINFSGGGGSGAAAHGLVNNAGKMIAVVMDNWGTGYTSAPTATPASGTATLTATVGINNTEGNTIRVFLQNTAVMKRGTGNLILTTDFTGNGERSITLIGRFGNWYEVSRTS